MNIKDLTNERIVFIGLGLDNYALLSYLAKHNSYLTLHVFDGRLATELGVRYTRLKKYKHITWHFGQVRPERLDDYSLIFKSPGAYISLKERKQLDTNSVIVTSALQLFLDICPCKNIIGVTGTKGKGTTSSLIYAMLKQGGKRVWLGGNIGVAVFDIFPRVKKTDWVILELSSFQLEDMRPNPRIAVFTNFSAEHLAAADPANPNHHSTLNTYWQAKLNLAHYQNKSGIIIANRSLEKKLKAAKLPGRITYTTASVLASKLPGKHNMENIAAAEAVARAVGIPDSKISKAVASFKGLPYRLEKVGTINGVEYVDDSLAGNPAGTITALKSFSKPIILLAGGADKGATFSAFAKVARKKTKAIVLFKGAATPRLKASLLQVGYLAKNMREVSSMPAAIQAARSFAKPGDVVLLSPACASFGLFKDYKDRGDRFKQEALR